MFSLVTKFSYTITINYLILSKTTHTKQQNNDTQSRFQLLFNCIQKRLENAKVDFLDQHARWPEIEIIKAPDAT